MDLITHIEDYIVYLITECGLSLTVHPMENESLITFSRLMRFNIHDNSYCTAVKSSAEGQLACVAQQRRVFKKCAEGEVSFCGVCHAGVLEYVYPISNGEGVIGFISVSGYACEAGEARVKKTAKRFVHRETDLQRCYKTLRTALPDKGRIDTLLLPLCHMLELAYRRESAEEKNESLTVKICRYARQHYDMDLTTEHICQAFYCSRSQLSHTFKKETGVSFREYLTQVRLAHAKRLLIYSALNVTEISFSVGFRDANYFSSVFKKEEGASPLAYRKNKKQGFTLDAMKRKDI